MRRALPLAAVALAALLAPVTARADAAADAFTVFARLVERGDIDAGTLPAALVSGEGCVVTFIGAVMDDDLGAPVRMVNSADVTTLDFDGFTSLVTDGQVMVSLPASVPVPYDLAFASDDPAARDRFAAQVPGAACDGAQCLASTANPLFSVVLFGGTAPEARDVRDALRSFAALCPS